MVRVEDVRPPHQRIAAELRARIMSGDLAPGEQLPTTQRLMSSYGVSNQTIQRGLAVLKREGFLVGRAGSGVYVRERPQQTIEPAAYVAAAPAGAPYSWVSEAARRSRRGETRIVAVGEVAAPAQVAQALGIDPRAVVQLRHRVMLLDGEPAEVVWSYYPVGIARGTGLAESRRIKGGAPRLLAEMGLPPREFVDRVSVRLPTSEEFVALELPPDVPVLRTIRVIFTDDARPIEVTVMVKAGHRCQLEYHVEAD